MESNSSLYSRASRRLNGDGVYLGTEHTVTPPAGYNQDSGETTPAKNFPDDQQTSTSGNDSFIVIPDTPSPVFSRFVGKRGKLYCGKVRKTCSDQATVSGDEARPSANTDTTDTGVKLSEGQMSEGRSEIHSEAMGTPENAASPRKHRVFEGGVNVSSPKSGSRYRSKFFDAKGKVGLSPGKVKISPYVPPPGRHFKSALQEMMDKHHDHLGSSPGRLLPNPILSRSSHLSSGEAGNRENRSGNSTVEPCNNVHPTKIPECPFSHTCDSLACTISPKGNKGGREPQQSVYNFTRRRSGMASSPAISKRLRLDKGTESNDVVTYNTWPSESSDSDSDVGMFDSQTLQSVLADGFDDVPLIRPSESGNGNNTGSPPKRNRIARKLRDHSKSVTRNFAKPRPVSHDVTSARSSDHSPQGPVNNHRREKMDFRFDDGFSRVSESDWLSPDVNNESRSRKMAAERSRAIQLAAIESRSNQNKSTVSPGTGSSSALFQFCNHGKSSSLPILCDEIPAESTTPQRLAEQVEGDEEYAKKLQEQLDMEFALSLQNLENQPPMIAAGTVLSPGDFGSPNSYIRGQVSTQGRWVAAQRGRNSSRVPDLDEVEALLRELDEPEERLLQYSPQGRVMTRTSSRAHSARLSSSIMSSILEAAGTVSPPRQSRSRRRGNRRNHAMFAIASPTAGEDYEDLLNLAEMLGDVKNKGLTEAQRSRLPVRTYQANSEKPEQECLICMSEYEKNDQLKMLPCFHQFHAQCIDQWIKGNASCPVCRVDVKL